MQAGGTGEEGCLPAIFALLDDSQAKNGAGSRLYTDFSHESVCTDPAALTAFWQTIDTALRAGLFAVLQGDYEWGVALQRLEGAGDRARMSGPHLASATAAARTDSDASAAGDLPPPLAVNAAPALRVLLFRRCRCLSESAVAQWLASQDVATAPAGIVDVHPSTTEDAFTHAIDAIHAALRAGDCYQINYTFRLGFKVFGSPLSLYRQLRERQPVPYGALIRTAAGWTLSASPELFIRHAGGRVIAKPMKGTAARDPDPVRDAQRGADLQADPKNRAENVMIVDLLRNDLGRIAPPGGVSVSALFAVEAWPTVWQMTSTVEAQLPATTTFPDVLRALFPCGSITGAPKRAAMAIIESLESTPRALYTGAIGWIDAPGRAPEMQEGGAASPLSLSSVPSQASHDAIDGCGHFCLSVAIRTLQIDAEPQSDGLLTGNAGIGAGIVLDSEAADEYEECLLKARFLTHADPGFALFETMRAVEKNGQDDVLPLASDGHTSRFVLPERERHLARLGASAKRFGFRWERSVAEALLERTLMGLTSPGPHRLKLSLSKDGTLACPAGQLGPLAYPAYSDSADPMVPVLLASEYGFPAMRSNDFLLRFKTTARAVYDRAWQQAEQLGAFDMLFVNEHGRVTEGGRSNLLVKLDGRWYTPPVTEGLLPGVMRASLLADPAWALTERPIELPELLRADALAISNGLRGAMPASLVRV